MITAILILWSIFCMAIGALALLGFAEFMARRERT